MTRLTMLGAIAFGGLAAAPVIAQEVSFSSGPATTVIAELIDCGRRSRVSGVGEIVSEDGVTRTVPAATHFLTGPYATDMYNECDGVKAGSVAEVDLSAVEVIDAGGTEEFTAYIFGDNYFELYVNGQLVAIDPVPFTPFNSNVVKFTADRPVSIAVMGVDWEENLGLGSEANRGSNYAPGDAGIVMQIQDATGETVAVTGADWRAQTFYTSPLPNRECLVADGQLRDSSACGTNGSADSFAAFWDIPADWMQPSFDDRVWPSAVTFSNRTVGVDNKPAYTNFTDLFDAPEADAQFIWSSNLVLDNLVLLRTTLE